MRRWMAALLLAAACNGDKDGETGDTGDTIPDPQTTSTGPARVATILTLTGDPTAGAQTFTTLCAACHGANGEGSASGAVLTERVPLLTDEQIVVTILEGKENMDAYKYTLDNQQVADVMAHLRANFDN